MMTKAPMLREAVSFNINNYVRVRLTARGIAYLKEFDLEWKLKYSAAPDADGWSRWQLHDLMNTFGSLLFPGSTIPFETEIELLPDTWPV
jgi:hypothetical protein